MSSLRFNPDIHSIVLEAIVKDLPPDVPVDGLLGLSFLRNFKLTVDFKKGLLSLE